MNVPGFLGDPSIRLRFFTRRPFSITAIAAIPITVCTPTVLSVGLIQNATEVYSNHGLAERHSAFGRCEKRLARTLMKIAKRRAEDASPEDLSNEVIDQARIGSAPADRSAWLSTLR